eukprot:SAG31_NODE_7591_length_1645_cov_84.368047_3_plen_85_part_01
MEIRNKYKPYRPTSCNLFRRSTKIYYSLLRVFDPCYFEIIILLLLTEFNSLQRHTFAMELRHQYDPYRAVCSKLLYTAVLKFSTH